MKTIVAILLALLLLFPGQLSAQETIQVVFTRWEPYGYMDKGKAAGFELEIFDAVMSTLGKSVVYTELPWKRCLLFVRQGMADAVVSVIRTPERDLFMLFPQEAISVNETAFFTTADQQMVFNGSLESFRNQMIGVISGFSYGPSFDSADYLLKDEATTTEQVIRKLLAGRYALAVGNVHVVSLITSKMGQREQIRFLRPLVHSEPLYVGFSKSRIQKDLVRMFSRALAEFKNTSHYGEILARYGLTPTATEERKPEWIDSPGPAP